jgi:transketolase
MLTNTHKLAGNPKGNLVFSKVIRGSDGEPLNVADPVATRAMIALMDMNAVLGGAASHYGGPAAFAEIMSAIHGIMFSEAIKKNQNWYDLYNFVNDAGHCENGIYAVKANYGFAGLEVNSLKGFRSIKSPLSGHGEAHLFPEGVLLSNGPLGSAFPQSQGLALGDSLAERSRVTITAISDGACMEGEAREAMAAIPGFAAKGQLAPYVLVISDNNTKLSGRIDKEAFSMAPTFSALSTLGWKVITLEDGHDLQNCYDVISSAIEEARTNPKVPIAIHAKTIKGIGTKKTEESSSGGHGFPCKSPKELPEFISEIYDGAEVPQLFKTWIEELLQVEKDLKKSGDAPFGPEEKIQIGVSSAMIRARKNGLPVVSVTSDLPGSTGVAGFRKEYPHYSIDVGIAESNMVSTAAGLTKAGFIPVVDTFAQFGVTKGALPFIMASLSNAPLIAIFSHTGFQDAADGASHQSLTYFSMMASIPGVEVYALTCSEEADQLVFEAIERHSAMMAKGQIPPSTVFFLGRENFPKNYSKTQSYKLDQVSVIQNVLKDKNVTIVAPGSMMYQGLMAAEVLNQKNIGTQVVNPGCLNKIDTQTFAQLLKLTGGKLIVIEDHQRIASFGSHLVSELKAAKVSFEVEVLGVNGHFGQSAYTAQELYAKHSIDSEQIVTAAKRLF